MKRNGYTVIELMIAIVVGLVLATIVFGGCGQLTGMDHRKATDEARQFAVEMGLDLQGLQCQNTDSNNDGYVSCTLRVKENGQPKLMPVECAAAFSWNQGCRLPARMLVQP